MQGNRAEQMIRTSLLIPCYRAEKYLVGLLSEVKNLRPAFDEVLLVDDCSDDQTFAKARELGFDIVRLDSNLGPGGARNELARRCSGEWIHFLDADDKILPHFLEITRPLMTESCDVILCSGDFVDEDTGEILKRWSFKNLDLNVSLVSELFENPVPTFCSTIRRSRFLEVGGFSESVRCWEDGDLHLRLAANGSRFVAVEQVLSVSPRHNHGASSSPYYCHQCRLKFIEEYITLGLPIRPKALVDELLGLGFLIVSAGKYRNAYRAFCLATQLGAERALSRNSVFDLILRLSPIALGHFFSTWIRSAASRHNQKFKDRRFAPGE